MTDRTKKINTDIAMATKVTHAGAPEVNGGGAFNQGPVFASTYHLHGATDSADLQYGRFDNPSWQALESALSELEGGDVCIFPSGMAAVAAALSSLTRQGSRVVMQSDGYYASRAYVERFLQPFGVDVSWLATRDFFDFDFTNIDLIFAETPSNPLMEVLDIERLSAISNQVNAKLIIDNTTLTPLAQQPLKWGADLVVCSDTKAVNGHSDIVFGHVAANSKTDLEEIRTWRKLSGNIPGPMETWLVHRGLATLDVRMQRMCENALVAAEFLNNHPKVNRVFFPGKDDHPQREVIKKQQTLAGFVISFDLLEESAADQFLESADLLYQATSFGGIHTMAERRARWGTDDVSPGLIRLSVGCESIDDIINNLTKALEAL